MKDFITYELVTTQKLVSDHPKVNKVWETGGLAGIPIGSAMFRTVHILLKDGTRKDFEDDGNGEAIKQANEYLNYLI